MYQTDQPTASNTLPTPAPAGTQGYFTNGNPATGVPPTIVDADWLNMMMMELINVVLAAGETPSKTTYNQVALAVKRLVQTQAVLADTGTANAYIAANTPPLTALPTSSGLVQRVTIAHANTGASTYAPDGLTAKPIYGLNLSALQGGELVVNGIATMMYLVAPTVNSGNGAWILLECTGGALQVPPATQPQHAVPMGQVQAMPFGAGVTSAMPVCANLNSAPLGWSEWANSSTNTPVASTFGICLTVSNVGAATAGNGNWLYQRAYDTGGNAYERISLNGAAYSAWQQYVSLGQMQTPIAQYATTSGTNTTLTATVSFTAPGPGVLVAIGNRNLNTIDTVAHQVTLNINGNYVDGDNTMTPTTNFGTVTTGGGAVSASYTASAGVSLTVRATLIWIPTV
jgi:hypothetical protein